jgi:cyclophilin family peptidyl-prolyl cis-trans isomerase
MGSGGSGARVPYEDSGLPNDTGYVGLSTLPRDRDSGDSQFYILLGPSRFLDGQYTVFGRVTQGMDVVRSIQLGDRITSIR